MYQTCELDNNTATVKTVDQDGKVAYWCSTCYKELQRDIKECGLKIKFKELHFAKNFPFVYPR